MEYVANFTAYEWTVFGLGVVGGLIALYYMLIALPRRRRRPKGLGIEAKRIERDAVDVSPTDKPAPKPAAGASWWSALAKTREKFFRLGGSGQIESIKEALEEACLVSDLGVGNTEEALSSLDWAQLSQLPEGERLEAAKNQLAAVIRPWLSASGGNTNAAEDVFKPDTKPKIIWFVGVNGVGKTTSIAKFALELTRRGHTVLLAAGDTFRAAASEQLEIWAERLNVPCVKGVPGGDSSAVLFDAIQSAQAKNIDFVLCDSAGRLHNQGQLMEALAKNRRVMAKALPGAPHEVLLVLDANTGQNMLSQAENFISTVGVTGLVLTKLDGTARGGAVVAVARKTRLPIRRLGLGEKAEDFVVFDPEKFSSALLGLSEP